jgi:coenzyme F420-reducing hydrogenase delta subunit
MCLGRLHLGLILKAFELGADGVILLGCPSGDCHYESGTEKAKELLTQARKILHLLGIDPKRLALAEVPLGRGDILARRLTSFAKRISGAGSNQLRSKAKAASPA